MRKEEMGKGMCVCWGEVQYTCTGTIFSTFQNKKLIDT